MPAPDALTGTWATTPTTCKQQRAAVEAAGFTPEQQRLGGWDETCGDMRHGSQFTIRFASGRLAIFLDGSHEWEGNYRVADADTFDANDPAAAEWYLTYDYAIDGDQLTIDMIRDDFPASSEAELLGDQIAQTVIYESAVFSRQDYTTTSFAAPLTLVLDPMLNPVPVLDSPNLLTWDAASSGDDKVRFLLPVEVYRPGSTTPEPPPADYRAYLQYLQAQSAGGAVFADLSTTSVGGHPATLMTATTDRPLSGSLGCPVSGGDQEADCFGIQPDVSARLAVIDLGDSRTLLAWARTSAQAPNKQFLGMFERLLRSVTFR